VRTLLTVPEVALNLRVSNMTVYRLIHSRKLPAYRIGRSYRLDPDLLKRFIEENEQRASGALASQPEPPGQFVRTP